LFEAHPNFSKDPFSIRCSEFVSFHGSAVTLRPQLVLPQSPHPFVLAMNQFGQDSSAVSSDFFSGFHELASMHLPSSSHENVDVDRNIVSPFPEPAFPPQPSVYPQIQAISSSLDNPSVVFQKHPVTMVTVDNRSATSLGSNALGLVQTIIQQQNTISKLQCEKDQLLKRIMELESQFSKQEKFCCHSSGMPGSKDTVLGDTSSAIVNIAFPKSQQQPPVSDVFSSEAVSSTAIASGSPGMSDSNCAVSTAVFLNSCSSIENSNVLQVPLFCSSLSSSSLSCHALHEFRQTSDSAFHSW
jgi:hypothetical protein